MSKEIKIQNLHKSTIKKQIIEQFQLSNEQIIKIDKYINEVCFFNKHTNIVGKSTLTNPWRNHILDCIQLSKFIQNKNSSILDMGSGAGLPGLILAIYNYTNVSLIDSNSKKIRFITSACSKLNFNVKIYHQRIESLKNSKYDYLVSRALSNLNKLFFYSQNIFNKKTVLIFLKGKQISEEIQKANKFWKFKYDLYPSISDKRGRIIVIKDLNKINE